MPAKKKKAKPSARRKPAAKRKKSAPEISPAEVTALEAQAASHNKSETAWLSLSNAPADEGDQWTAVEEDLRRQERERDSERRWKHFAKLLKKFCKI